MANAIYQKAGTAITWNDSSGDLAMTLNNLASGAGRQGAQKDWGALSTARATRYHFRFQCSFETAPVVAETVIICWKSGDGTYYDNDDGTGDVAVSAQDKLRNLKRIGTLEVDEATVDIRMSVEGTFEDFNRYGMPVIWNATADNLQATANDASIVVTPIYDEIQ